MAYIALRKYQKRNWSGSEGRRNWLSHGCSEFERFGREALQAVGYTGWAGDKNMGIDLMPCSVWNYLGKGKE